MKKLLNKKRRVGEIPKLKSFVKSTFLLMLFIFSTLTIQANNTKPNQISIHLNNASVSTLLDKLENTTSYQFIYKIKDVDLKRTVSINIDNESIDTVLKNIFKNTKTDYLVLDYQVFLKPKILNTKIKQTNKISGTVTDNKGIPIPNVNIIEQTTNNSTITDFDGKFTLYSENKDITLEFKHIAFKKLVIAVMGRSELSIVMEEHAEVLNEVILTALNVKRQKKTIGYATQNIKGKELSTASEPNLLNTISGKIAGAQVTSSNGGVGASTNIVLRGNRFVDGNNSPLFVIDGVPISNQTHQTTRNFGGSGNPNQSGFLGEGEFGGDSGEIQIDFGNAAAEINPQDIESMQVLKGATAAALYGARSANGVILITTKKGNQKKGLGISVSSNLSFQTPLVTPEFQTTFGKGQNGLYDFNDLNQANSAKNFGPRFNGQDIPQYDFNNPLVAKNRPWVNRLGSDPVGDFLETGITQTHNVSVSNGTDKGSYRFSFGLFDQKGMVPNTDLKRYSIGLNSHKNLSDKLTVSTSANYINSKSDNTPEIGAKNESNLVYTLLTTGGNQSLNELKNYWEPFKENQQQATADKNINNPYFLAYENINAKNKHRVFGNINAKYNFTKDFSVRLQSGLDFYRENRTSKKAISHFPYINGFYAETELFYQENNTEILLDYQKKINNISIHALGGANRLDLRSKELRANTGRQGIVVPDLFNFSNAENINTSGFSSQKRINSVYGALNVGLNDYLFLDVTGRNDWSSALPSKNNSYFYPSASLSAIITDIFDFDLGNHRDYIKTRFSYAEVRNDTNPYETNPVSINGGNSNDITTNNINATLGNEDLRPEKLKTFEAGIEANLFKSRFYVDASFYQSKTDDQIIDIPLAPATGFAKKTINLPATMTNTGFEVSATITPVKTTDFQWDINLNWSTNKNKISGIGKGERIQLAERWINLDLVDGGSYGDFYGDYLLKVDENGNLGQTGKQIYRNDGRAEESDDVGSLIEVPKALLGNANPDWIAGIGNTLKYNDFSLSFLFDINKGGQIYSRTYVAGNKIGALKESAQTFNRDNEKAIAQAIAEGQTVKDGEHWVILDGATLDKTTGETTPANFAARTENVYKRYFDNDAIGTFDRTFVKLREVKLSYQIPQKMTNWLSIDNASFTLYGRNLFLWTKVPHIDPESAGYSGELIGGEFFALPSARSFGFNLIANF